MFVRSAVLCCILLLPNLADARSVSLSSCVVTIGRFCPVETVGFAVAAVALFFFAGIPLRWLIKRHVSTQVQANPLYEVGGALRFLYRYAGYLSFAAVFFAVFALFT